MARILIIDDDMQIANLLSKKILSLGHSSAITQSCEDGVRRAQSSGYDIIFLDVNLPDGSGLDIIPQLRNTIREPEIIIITGFGDEKGAEIAVKNGAWDYICKTSSLNTIELSLSRAIQYHEGKRKAETPIALNTSRIKGKSRIFQNCLNQLAKAANNSANVLITGETGTGKELFALGIHQNSSRSHAHFVVVDCASLPENLVESMLFGHVKGAFTGAEKEQIGLIEQAHNGTLFLDEIGEMPLEIQKKFLRVVQEHTFRPIGAKVERESDFRLIAATNRNLEEMVAKGGFRHDLLYRLRSIHVDLPPLRVRKEDIKELAIHFVTQYCERNSIGVKGFSPDFFDEILRYPWPGNIRELSNAMESTVAEAIHDSVLFSSHVPVYIRIANAKTNVVENTRTESENLRTAPLTTETPFPSLKQFMQKKKRTAEKEYLLQLLSLADSNVENACTLAGISRSRLYGMLKHHQLALQ